MPHLCDDCGRSFPNGSKQMLSGCPECGGNKFQYVAESETPQAGHEQTTGTDDALDDSDIIEADPDIETQDEDSAQSAARGEILEPGDENADYGGSVSDLVSGLQSDYGPQDDAQSTSEDESTDTTDNEDVPDIFEADGESGTVTDDPDADDHDNEGERVTNVNALRDELLDQFESINILEPGSYELNLVKLYEREEHIIQIQEDGKYVIQMPER